MLIYATKQIFYSSELKLLSKISISIFVNYFLSPQSLSDNISNFRTTNQINPIV